MIKEVHCQKAIEDEYESDGGKLPVIDACDGCQDLTSRYQKTIETGSDPYYQELKDRYAMDARVKFVFCDS